MLSILISTLIGTVYTIAVAWGGFSFGVFVCKKVYENRTKGESDE